jgi:TonB family protein
MSEDKENPSPAIESRDAQRPDAMHDAEHDGELNALLQHWAAPAAPRALDQKLLLAFRAEKKSKQRASVWRRLLATFKPIPPQPQPHTEEVLKMKECPTCHEEFADKFSFCPVDATPLNELAAALVATPLPRGASINSQGDAMESSAVAPFLYGAGYHLTMIEDEGLTRRLFNELRATARESQLTWPDFKRDPFAFVKRSVTTYAAMLWRFLSSPNVAIATTVALVVMFTAIIGIVALDRYHAAHTTDVADNVRDDIEYLGGITEIPPEQEKVEKGAAGMNKGNGGGSLAKQEKPAGGGGGGRSEDKPASVGKLPQASLTIPQVLAPDPNPPKIKNPSLPVAATIDADPLLFPTDNRPIAYGDPKSKSTEISSGTGTGNGIGTGEGGGVGSGDGGGVGPGHGGNTGGGDRRPGGGGPGGSPNGGGGEDYNRIFSTKDVTQKARIISKPEAQYTEEARKNQVTGTVVLRAVLGSNGQVTGIRAVNGLPNGLTEKAISAAHLIKFTPATKDGRAVSQYIQIEYSFNLY